MTPSDREPLHFHLLMALCLAVVAWGTLQAFGARAAPADPGTSRPHTAASLLLPTEIAADADADVGPGDAEPMLAHQAD